MSTREMVYFRAGETVRLKQDIPNKPKMIIKRVVKSRMNPDGETQKEDKKKMFIGIKCFWFTDSGLYQEVLFSTKDLEKAE